MASVEAPVGTQPNIAGAQPATTPATTTTTAKKTRGTSRLASGGRIGGLPFLAVRIGVLVAFGLQLLGVIVYLGGLSAVQKRANDFDLGTNLGVYWWTFAYELAVTVSLLGLLISTGLLSRLKLLAVGLLVYALVLATNACSAFRDAGFGSRSKAALAGAILMAISNLLSVVMVGLSETDTGTTSNDVV